MDDNTIRSSSTQSQGSQDKPDHKVKVTVDGKQRNVRPGEWIVLAFKEEVKVGAEKELQQIIDGVLTPLEDSGTIVIKGGETIVSHARKGGSS